MRDAFITALGTSLRIGAAVAFAGAVAATTLISGRPAHASVELAPAVAAPQRAAA